MAQREFEVGEHMLEDTCPVCKNKLKLKEKIVLCRIQEPKSGYANVMCLSVHTKCYWVEE